MATRNIVPRGNNEGNIGTRSKWWQGARIRNIEADIINANHVSCAERLNTSKVNQEYELGVPSLKYIMLPFWKETQGEQQNISQKKGEVAKLNSPFTSWFYCLRMSHESLDGYCAELAIEYWSGEVYVRTIAENKVYTPWKRLLNETDYEHIDKRLKALGG